MQRMVALEGQMFGGLAPCECFPLPLDYALKQLQGEEGRERNHADTFWPCPEDRTPLSSSPNHCFVTY